MPILHWHVKIYASTPENLTPLIISRKLFVKSVTIFYIIPQQQFHKHEGSDLVGFIFAHIDMGFMFPNQKEPAELLW